MWAELVHCHFLYVPAVLNVVTTGNGTGTKNVLKWNRALGFEFSIQSFVYGAESKPILYLSTSLPVSHVPIYIYMYIRIAFFIELRLRVSRSLRSLAKKIQSLRASMAIGTL